MVKCDPASIKTYGSPAVGAPTGTLEFRHLPSSALPDSVLRFRVEMEKRIQARAAEYREPQRGEVRLFTAQWCPYCKRAKTDLAKRGLAYTEYDIDTPEGMAAHPRFGSVGAATSHQHWTPSGVFGGQLRPDSFRKET